jgi:hypothetical protein
VGRRQEKLQILILERRRMANLDLDFNWQSFSKNSNRAFCGLAVGKFLNIAFNGQSST